MSGTNLLGMLVNMVHHHDGGGGGSGSAGGGVAGVVGEGVGLGAGRKPKGSDKASGSSLTYSYRFGPALSARGSRLSQRPALGS